MRRALTAVGVLLLALPVAAKPAVAAVPPNVGRLAVRLSDAVVVVMDSDGARSTQLEAGRRAVDAFTLAWSPDATRLAAAMWYFSPQREGVFGVGVFDLASGDKDMAWSDPPVNPTWSPDGRRVAYVTSLPGPGWSLETAAPGGCCRRTILTADHMSADARPSWSADGRFVYAVVLDDAGVASLLRVPVTGGPPRVMAPGFVPWEVDVSPNGRHLAMCGTGPAGFGVYTARADGTAVRHLAALDCAHDHRGDRLAWSPDGRWLAAMDGSALHRVDPITGGSTVLADVATGTVTWSPDGIWLAFVGTDTAWLVGADGSGLVAVPGTAGAYEVYFAPA